MAHADVAGAGFLQQGIQAVLVVFIERAGGLVEKGKLWLTQKETREGYALLGDLLFTAQVEAGSFSLALREFDLNESVASAVRSAQP